MPVNISAVTVDFKNMCDFNGDGVLNIRDMLYIQVNLKIKAPNTDNIKDKDRVVVKKKAQN